MSGRTANEVSSLLLAVPFWTVIVSVWGECVHSRKVVYVLVRKKDAAERLFETWTRTRDTMGPQTRWGVEN
jgi:hypothetical protein